MSNARSRDLIKQDGLSGRREARFLRFFEVKRLHAVKMPGGVWDVTGVTGDRSWNVHSKGRVR